MLEKTKPNFWRGQPGYYSLADVPQRGSIESICKGTGWHELDEIWKLYAGQFVVVTGIAGHGKSTFLLNVICNMAKANGTKSFLYVPENEGHIRDKLSMIWGDADGWELFSNTQCFVQTAELNDYDQAPRTLDWILNKAVVAIEEDGVSVVMIDPWNEIERAKPKDMMMTDYIGMCLMWIKQFCRLYNVTFIMVAHPTKAGVSEGKTPTLADIEGSMNWYNKCDNGLIVVREPVANSCKVISAKVREIGAGKRGACFFQVDPHTGRFVPEYGAVG